jgi:hypothetical protein
MLFASFSDTTSPWQSPASRRLTVPRARSKHSTTGPDAPAASGDCALAAVAQTASDIVSKASRPLRISALVIAATPSTARHYAMQSPHRIPVRRDSPLSDKPFFVGDWLRATAGGRALSNFLTDRRLAPGSPYRIWPR